MTNNWITVQNQFDEIQKQFASMNMDSWYRFGIDSENSKTNAEVFESAVEAIEHLDKKMKDQKRYTEKLMFFVTAALVSMIVMVAYITTI